MRVSVAGATGVLGRRLVRQFRGCGHGVVGLVRSAEGERTVRSLGGEPRQADLFDANSLARAAEGEQIAREAGARHGFQVAVLRCGGFYSADAAHSRMLAEGLARRRLPIIGRGDAVMALIHSDDAAGAFVAAAEAARDGLWHVVDDRPVPVAELLTTLAQKLGAPPPRHVPAWLARLVAGRTAVEYFTTSTQTSNRKFKEEVGWKPRFPTIREGLEEVVYAWRSEGIFASARKQ